MSGSARRTGWGSGWDKGRLAGWQPHMLSITRKHLASSLRAKRVAPHIAIP